MISSGYPRHRENRENGQKKSLSGRTQGFFFPEVGLGPPTQFCVCNSHKIYKLAQGKFTVGQGKHRESTGTLKIQFEWVPC